MRDEQQHDPADSEPAQDEVPDDAPLTIWQLLSSAFAAAIGVQSSENRKRDFSRGRPGQFIAIGILFTVLFVLVMIGVVNLVLSAVG
jgi:hypothetical protein